jgi:hypothetical protein
MPKQLERERHHHDDTEAPLADKTAVLLKREPVWEPYVVTLRSVATAGLPAAALLAMRS